MNDVIDKMHKSTSGLHAKNAEYVKEVKEVINFYEFYDGKPDNFKEVELSTEYGQVWAVPDTLDYKPTREVRNHTRKLIDKQARFMFGVPPTLTMKPFDKEQKDAAEEKRMVVDKILDDTDFWGATGTAFLDATIGKRVLLCIIANQGEPLQFRYFKMSEFTYVVDPNDCNKLLSVEICYQDECTIGKLTVEERWHRWKYEMRNGACWCLYEIVDGLGNTTFIETPAIDEEGNELDRDPVIVPLSQEFNTGFSQLPCRVIKNGGLTGDTQGTSDVKDLIDLAKAYNRVNSDYRDALRFKMFEQPVFIDADSNELSKIKIAPNAIIDLKTDPSIGDGTGTGRSAQATTLSSTFNFAPAADSYLDRLKKDMYELMDQPLPEQLANVPSGKALRFMFFDLMARCEEKWRDWEPAIKWLIKIMEEACNVCNLYPEMQAKSVMATITNVGLSHNYPIPDDEELTKEIAIKEVQANVMSHKTYIRKYGDVEDEQGEWDEIMEEMDDLNGSTNSGFMETVDETIETVEGPTQVAGEGTEEDGEDNFNE